MPRIGNVSLRLRVRVRVGGGRSSFVGVVDPPSGDDARDRSRDLTSQKSVNAVVRVEESQSWTVRAYPGGAV